MNKVIFLLLLSLVLLPLHVFVVAQEGSWIPISDVKNRYIVQMGEYAVREYNGQSKSGLKFVTVVRGELLRHSEDYGVNYRLVVAVNDGTGPSKNYEATVVTEPGRWNLLSFKPLASHY